MHNKWTKDGTDWSISMRKTMCHPSSTTICLHINTVKTLLSVNVVLHDPALHDRSLYNFTNSCHFKFHSLLERKLCVILNIFEVIIFVGF
jgi:hypothetical protein